MQKHDSRQELTIGQELMQATAQLMTSCQQSDMDVKLKARFERRQTAQKVTHGPDRVMMP